MDKDPACPHGGGADRWRVASILVLADLAGCSRSAITRTMNANTEMGRRLRAARAKGEQAVLARLADKHPEAWLCRVSSNKSEYLHVDRTTAVEPEPVN